MRWDEANPRIGVDPDVCVLSPPPPEGTGLRSLRTWEVGHAAPLLAVEVVSETNLHKDYVVAPDKYAASGTRELWIFDPLLAGPASHGGTRTMFGVACGARGRCAPRLANRPTTEGRRLQSADRGTATVTEIASRRGR